MRAQTQQYRCARQSVVCGTLRNGRGAFWGGNCPYKRLYVGRVGRVSTVAQGTVTRVSASLRGSVLSRVVGCSVGEGVG